MDFYTVYHSILYSKGTKFPLYIGNGSYWNRIAKEYMDKKLPTDYSEESMKQSKSTYPEAVFLQICLLIHLH